MNSMQINAVSTFQSGQLRMGFNGEPYITVDVINETSNSAFTAEFLIDTGFNGFVQLNSTIVETLHLNIQGKSIVSGFDNQPKETGIVLSKIKISGLEVTGLPIQVVENGNLLLGTSFLKVANLSLVIDYRHNHVFFSNDLSMQQRVQTALLNG